MDYEYLKGVARKIRLNVLEMIYLAKSGHPGSSFSCVDILVALYFGKILNFNCKNPKSPDRDFFIMSKGHGCPALYSVLGELGFFDKENFDSLRQVDSLLQGHPETFIPGIEVASGPLGQGLSVANGISLGLKIDNKYNKVFVLVGDGEMQEGNFWEAIMTASKYKLDNLVLIVDRNKLQIDGSTEEICPLENLKNKFLAFNWHVEETDGHNIEKIITAINNMKKIKNSPKVIIANTIKGKGVDFMENQVGWHGKAPNLDEFEVAKKQLI